MYRNKQQAVQDVRPINSIMSLKSNEDLLSYLEDRPQLNLSIMTQKNGSTLLHFAAFKNELSKLKIYILHFQAYARQNLKQNRMDPSFENQLKAWINVQNKDGICAIHFAGLHGNIEMIQFLQKYGANMQAVTNQRQDLLFMAIQNNHLKTLCFLLQHRDGKIPFNPNTQNNLGDTILHKASTGGLTSIVAYLLSFPPQQIDRNVRNNQGDTPLICAVKGGNKEVVKRMLMKGVDRRLKNQEEQSAIDVAGLMGRGEIVRVLREDWSGWERCQIACNVKVVYRVQEPTKTYSLLFLFLLHLLYLPTNILVQVTLFSSPYYFYALALLFYLSILILFILLTRKHPKKRKKDILQLQLPICAQCRQSIKPNQYHCFICDTCVWRYDHHCPWINNCVSALNIGKFILFIVLLIIASVQVMWMSMCLHFPTVKQIKPTTLIPIDSQLLNLITLGNMIICGILSAVFCILLFNLLGDQLKNITTNTTSYQRAKMIKKGSLLTTVNRSMNTQDDFQAEEEEDDGNCVGNCCQMLREKYRK